MFLTQSPNFPPSVGGRGRSYIINSRDSGSQSSSVVCRVQLEVTEENKTKQLAEKVGQSDPGLTTRVSLLCVCVCVCVCVCYHHLWLVFTTALVALET